MPTMSETLQRQTEAHLAAAERRFAEASEAAGDAYRELEDRRHAARAARELSGPVAYPDAREPEHPEELLGVDTHPDEP